MKKQNEYNANNFVTTSKEVDFLFANRHNLKNFHYYTNNETVYDYFCLKVANILHLKEDPKTASNITEEELGYLNKKYSLSLQAAYLNGPTCSCGRCLNGYDFILNAIFQHGRKFLIEPVTKSGAKFIMPFRSAIKTIVCSNCGELVALSEGYYKDVWASGSYGPCVLDDELVIVAKPTGDPIS